MSTHLLTAVALGLFTSAVLSVSSEAAEKASRNTSRDEPAQETSAGPRTIVISLRKQRLRLFDGNREIASSRISSGRSGFDTPTGVFSILEKKKYHESNIYAGAPMPFMQRITWSGIAMHAGVVPGYRASHGCVRLPYSFAKTFFGRTDVGGRVIITNDEVAPRTFEHPTLFKPLPEFDPPAPTQGANAQGAVVASNDTTAADKAALHSLVAGAIPPSSTGKPRSRAEALRLQTEKLERLKTEMDSAQERKAAASEKAKAALRAAQDAEANYQSVRKPFEEVLKRADNAQTAREAAARAYRDYLIRLTKNEDAPKNSKRSNRGDDKDASPADRELNLEDRLLDLTLDADDARAESAEAQLAIADAKTAFATADAAKTQAIEEVKQSVVELRKVQTALVEARAEARRRDRQLSIFISLKSQRIYIRQGFEPVFETPIEVDDPPGAIGTHVLTVLDYDSTGNDFIWQLVSAQPPRPAVDDDDRKKKKKNRPQPVSITSPLNTEAVRAALDSIRIPQDVAERISELAKPGTSLIISEKDPSHETGKGTEFVVLTR
ncbi:MAG: L,D-transpeptidase family protein [Hyphomicrobiaceae bacterium]